MLYPDKKNYTEISVAVIQKDGCVLVGKRPKNKSFAGKWEFPGGKIEYPENPEECLVRELREELGVGAAIREPFLVWNYEYRHPINKKFRFHGFLCDIQKGEPRALWHDEISWISVHDLLAVDSLDADREIIPLVQKQFFKA